MKTCSAGRERLDRTYRRCQCPIHVEGKCGDRFVRQSLKTSNWQLAQQRVAQAEALGTWDVPLDPGVSLTTIENAIASFLNDAETGRRLDESTLRKYRLMLRQLQEFAARKGFRYLKELDVQALRDFRDSWKVGPRTALKKIERVRAFFRFAVDNDWIEKNTAKLVRGPANIKDVQKHPFEPDEMERILRACERIDLQVGTNEELLAFVLLLRYSGLRISDASLLSTDRVRGNDLFLYTQKSGTHVYVPLPPFLMDLLKRVPLRHGKYFFTGPQSLRMETVTDLWRRKLARVFRLASVPNGHPHRFRHTFAVELLKRGVPMEEVSVLLGHSSVRITERHYAAWVQARQDLLKAHVEKTWDTFRLLQGGKKA